MTLTEDAIEQNLIDLLKGQGYVYFNDAGINPTSGKGVRKGVRHGSGKGSGMSY